MTYIALACALALTGCVTTEGLGQRAVGCGFGLEHHGCSGFGRLQDGKQGGAAVDVFKAVTVSDEELKSVALQYRAYGDRTESWRRLTTNTPSAWSA